MTIKLYKFSRIWTVPDASPFCVKVESFLRLAKIDYENMRFSMQNMKASPKGKMPYIELENGEKIGDSNLIIAKLSEQYNIDLDASLSDEQRAISTAFRRMLDENTYWVALYSRWLDEPGWTIISNLFFGRLPPIIRQIAKSAQLRNAKNRLNGHGMGKHSKEEIYSIGCHDIKSLSDFLGNKDFFFGGKEPTMLDICAHAFVTNLINTPIENPLNNYAKTLQNLVDHTKRIDDIVYPEGLGKKKEEPTEEKEAA